MDKIIITRYDSPVGELVLASYSGLLCLCDWAESKHHTTTKRRVGRKLDAEFEEGSSEIIDKTIGELDEYFSGKRSEFSIPVSSYGTEFQLRVWSELMKIPYGTAITYSEVATRIGKPKAVRAVAAAIGANPLSILVPCHRVIGSDGSLTGYAGGLPAKKALLSLENYPID